METINDFKQQIEERIKTIEQRKVQYGDSGVLELVFNDELNFLKFQLNNISKGLQLA